MILIDANLLIYAYSPDSPFHRKARRWLEAALSGDKAVGLPLVSILAFLRVLSSPKLPGRATPAAVLAVVKE